jgi:hypothetical protein
MSAIHTSVAALALFALNAASHAQSTPAGQASGEASDASVASAESVAALSEAGFKVSVGVVAVPLALTGYAVEAVGAGSAAAGEEGIRFSDEPLTVTNRIAVRQPEPLPTLED